MRSCVMKAYARREAKATPPQAQRKAIRYEECHASRQATRDEKSRTTKANARRGTTR